MIDEYLARRGTVRVWRPGEPPLLPQGSSGTKNETTLTGWLLMLALVAGATIFAEWVL